MRTKTIQSAWENYRKWPIVDALGPMMIDPFRVRTLADRATDCQSAPGTLTTK